MEFGIQIEPQFGFTFEDIRAIAVEAEALGFTHLWITDHLFLRPDEPRTPCLEAWTLLAALAQLTSRLRLGSLVSCQSYRPPSLLAKMAAGVDVMSGGRLELGIGAGWKQVEYEAYGIPFPPAAVRLGQLVDAVEIIRAMWTQDRATYEGRHYAIHDALCAPKPVQRPHPPILIGGRRPRMLRIMARYADAVNFPDFFLPPLQYAAQLEALRRACARAGRDYDAIRKTHSTYTIVGRTAEEVDGLAAEVARRWNLTIEQARARLAGATAGTPAQVRERIEAYRALGVSQAIFLFPYGRERVMMRLLAEDVLPGLA